MKVLITHGFSAKNLGDGLLVEETIDIVRQAFGQDTSITLATHYPETFDLPGIRMVRSAPNSRGYSLEYLKLLTQFKSFDFIVAVGGGYMRMGYPLEMLKTGLVHLPQLAATALAGKPSVYLPQSIGPLRGGSLRPIRALLAKTSRVYLRDQRSISELTLPNAVRFPDLAALDVSRSLEPRQVDPLPVLSIRAIRGTVPAGIYELEKLLPTFDTYIQSTTGGNNDIPATETLNYSSILPREELMVPSAGPRVIVAVRLHAALMALRAGHYVVHLSYERKGFGAFEDLGLKDYVFNVNSFSPSQVADLVDQLLNNPEARAAYDQAIAGTEESRFTAKSRLIADLQALSPSAS